MDNDQNDSVKVIASCPIEVSRESLIAISGNYRDLLNRLFELEVQIEQWKKTHISFDEQAAREQRLTEALAKANAEIERLKAEKDAPAQSAVEVADLVMLLGSRMERGELRYADKLKQDALQSIEAYGAQQKREHIVEGVLLGLEAAALFCATHVETAGRVTFQDIGHHSLSMKKRAEAIRALKDKADDIAGGK